MRSDLQRKLEMLARVRDFGVAHGAIVPAHTRGAELFTSLGDIVTELQSLAATQASSRTSARNITISKAAVRAALIDALDAISLTAKGIAVATPGLDNKFRVPRNPTDQVLLASARAFANDAPPLKDQFIGLAMPASFIDDLQADIAEFEKVLTGRRQTKNSSSTSTSAMEGALNRGIKVVQQLKAVMHNTLHNMPTADDALMTAWLRASRTERSHAPSSTPPDGLDTAGGRPRTSPPPRLLQPLRREGPNQAVTLRRRMARKPDRVFGVVFPRFVWGFPIGKPHMFDRRLVDKSAISAQLAPAASTRVLIGGASPPCVTVI